MKNTQEKLITNPVNHATSLRKKTMKNLHSSFGSDIKLSIKFDSSTSELSLSSFLGMIFCLSILQAPDVETQMIEKEVLPFSLIVNY